MATISGGTSTNDFRRPSRLARPPSSLIVDNEEKALYEEVKRQRAEKSVKRINALDPSGIYVYGLGPINSASMDNGYLFY